MSDTQVKLIIGCSVLILPNLYLFISLLIDIIKRNKRKTRCSGISYGKIVGYESRTIPHNSSDDRTTYTTEYFPIIRYHINGNEIEKEYHYGFHKHIYEVGYTVNICYNPYDINELYIIDEKYEKRSLFTSFAVSIILTLLFTYFALILF